MSKVKNDVLFTLIKRMTKSEKRRFKLSSRMGSKDKDKIFVQVFDALEDMKNWDEKLLLSKVPKLKKSQLSNIKAHLQKHLLENLRHLHRPKKMDIEIRDLLDNARVFYSKGMYKAALQTLDKAKKLAKDHEMNTAYFNCVEFEKKIESQHITGSMHPTAAKLSDEVKKSLQHVLLNNELSNLALRLYGNYLKHSHVKDEKEAETLRESFLADLPKVEFESLDFYGKLYFLQSHVWFSYTIQDFANYFKYAHRWVNHYEGNPVMIGLETAMYLKGYHNLLNAYFTHNRYQKFNDAYIHFLEFKTKYDKKLDLNCQELVENIEWIHGLNRFFLNAEYKKGAHYLDELLGKYQHSIVSWNLHRKLTIYYKIACIYFGAERYEDAIEFLNKINNRVYPQFRNDIQCFSRILSLIAHYDLGNLVLVEYQVKSVYRFLFKLEEMQGVQLAIFGFLKKIPAMSEKQLIPAFEKLEQELIILRKLKFEQRAFLYLDIIAWLRSKIENVSIAEVIQRRLKLNQNFTYQ